MSIPILRESQVAEAAAILRDGGLLGLPTETVYGLAADAESPDAVARIYAAKGRPNDHPVIVHVADASAIDSWAVEIPAFARKLAAEFWPGPMTLVLRRSARAGDFVTGGQDTVGLRVPAHPTALAVLREFGGGLAAPSANKFGQVSPTSAQHVAQDLADVLDAKRDAVIDGGECEVGVESTIVDCTDAAPRILRPGAISAADVERATGLTVGAADTQLRVPGTLASHYAPTAAVRLVENAEDLNLVVAELAPLGRVGVVAAEPIATPNGSMRIAMPQTSRDYAQQLYAALRTADEMGMKYVVALLPSGHDIDAAIRDRLTRAAHGSS